MSEWVFLRDYARWNHCYEYDSGVRTWSRWVASEQSAGDGECCVGWADQVAGVFVAVFGRGQDAVLDVGNVRILLGSPGVLVKWRRLLFCLPPLSKNEFSAWEGPTRRVKLVYPSRLVEHGNWKDPFFGDPEEMTSDLLMLVGRMAGSADWRDHVRTLRMPLRS